MLGNIEKGYACHVMHVETKKTFTERTRGRCWHSQHNPLYNNLSSEKDSEMNVLNNEKFQLH